MGLLLRLYPALALASTPFFLPAAFSFAPLLLLGFYVYLRLPKRDPTLWVRIGLLTDFFLFFALAVLFQPRLGLFSVLPSLPLLGGLTLSLGEAARLLSPSWHIPRRRPSSISLTLLSIATLILPLSLLLGNQSLSLTAAASLTYLIILLVVVLRGLPANPLKEEKVRMRLVAGTRGEARVKFFPRTKLGGKLALSPCHDWLRLEPKVLLVDSAELGVRLQLSPPLSGPSEPEILGWLVDRWGLTEQAFELRPLQLYVIPRARYAAWIARKYLEGTGSGTLPLLSAPGTFRAATASRTGIEYYGNRPYQPGDSPRIIDWKHTAKLGELVSKEFSELKGRPALLLVNLAVQDAEEADKLAYKLITTALSLAQENIPSALAAYDHQKVRLVTPTLPPRATLAKALEVAEQVVIFASPLKYLASPNVERLRANLFRLRQVDSQPAKALSSLLEIEYRNLEREARENPATTALLEGLKKAGRESNLVVLSERNHDAEALAFNSFELGRRGYAVIEI